MNVKDKIVIFIYSNNVIKSYSIYLFNTNTNNSTNNRSNTSTNNNTNNSNTN